jgi:hypothetical protein
MNAVKMILINALNNEAFLLFIRQIVAVYAVYIYDEIKNTAHSKRAITINYAFSKW